MHSTALLAAIALVSAPTLGRPLVAAIKPRAFAVVDQPVLNVTYASPVNLYDEMPLLPWSLQIGRAHV